MMKPEVWNYGQISRNFIWKRPDPGHASMDNLVPLLRVLIFHIKVCCPIGPYTPISPFYCCVILRYQNSVSWTGRSSTVVG